MTFDTQKYKTYSRKLIDHIQSNWTTSQIWGLELGLKREINFDSGKPYYKFRYVFFNQDKVYSSKQTFPNALEATIHQIRYLREETTLDTDTLHIEHNHVQSIPLITDIYSPINDTFKAISLDTFFNRFNYAFGSQNLNSLIFFTDVFNFKDKRDPTNKLLYVNEDGAGFLAQYTDTSNTKFRFLHTDAGSMYVDRKNTFVNENVPGDIRMNITTKTKNYTLTYKGFTELEQETLQILNTGIEYPYRLLTDMFRNESPHRLLTDTFGKFYLLWFYGHDHSVYKAIMLPATNYFETILLRSQFLLSTQLGNSHLNFQNNIPKSKPLSRIDNKRNSFLMTDHNGNTTELTLMTDDEDIFFKYISLMIVDQTGGNRICCKKSKNIITLGIAISTLTVTTIWSSFTPA